MAQRPVFEVKTTFPYFQVCEVDFQWSAGFALVQRQKNIAAIHAAYLKEHPKAKILEASSKAPTPLGKSLSPFYLPCVFDGRTVSVECAFQACKVFQDGGPFLQLLDMEPIKAKTTSLTKTAGPLLYYDYAGRHWPLEPKGWLYEWIYMNALHAKPELAAQIQDYTAFTDIAFAPKTSVTCQAKALAIYLGLEKKGLLASALESIESFWRIVFHYKLR